MILLDTHIEVIKKRGIDKKRIVGLGKTTFKDVYKDRMKLYHKYADIIIPIKNEDTNSIVMQIKTKLKLS